MIGLVQKIVGGIALVVILSLSIALFIADRRADKWETQSHKLVAELNRISTAKNEQKERTRVSVGHAEQKVKDAETKAKKVEAAPLPGQCQTPKEVLDADI